MRVGKAATGLIVAVAGLGVAGAAHAQAAAATLSVHGAVCKLTGDSCDDEDPSTAPPRNATRGFSLARATAPAAPAAVRQASAPGYTAPRRQPAPTPGLSRPKRDTGGVSANDMMINFANGSAELTPGARANALNIATALKQIPAEKHFRIEGHTNAVGSADSNKALSEARAKALVDFLVQNGVDSSRLEPVGYGFDRPLPGRAAASPLNRRVEATLIR